MKRKARAHLKNSSVYVEKQHLSYFREISFHFEFVKIQCLANDGM